MKCVIYTEEWGIYLGSFFGMGFWSKLDPAGQIYTAVFQNIEVAMEFIKTWDNIPHSVKLVEVETKQDYYASIEECVKAGLPAWVVE